MGVSEDRLLNNWLPTSVTGYKTPKKRKREIGVDPKAIATEPLLGDTPLKDRAGNTDAMEFGDLAQRRRVVMEEISTFVPEITPDQFMDHFIPSNKDVDDCMNLIYDKVLQNGLIEGGDWVYLNNTKNEARDFKSYGKLEDRIRDIAQGVLGRNSPVKHYSDGNRVPVSIYPESDKNRPDGLSIIPSVWEFIYAYFHAFLIKEFKVGESDADKYDVSHERTHSLNEAHFRQNWEKIIYNAYRVLKEDWRRRFVFGISISNRTARLIFVCRAYIVVSEEFDICKASAACCSLTIPC